MFVLEVTNNTTFITEGRLSKEIYAEFKRALGYKSENEDWIKRSKIERARDFEKESVRKQMENWDGYYSTVCYNKAKCKCFVRKSCTHFPTGLLSTARDFFAKWNIPYKLIPAFSRPSASVNLSLSDDFEFRDYQIDVRNKACERGRGIIKVATGGGKTPLAASIITELGVVPFIFYVTSCDLLYQARDELQKFIRINGKPVEVGIVGGGEKDIKDITVMTVQTAVRALGAGYKKYDEEDKDKDDTYIDDIKEDIKELIQSAKGYFGDEVHHWAAATCQVISDASVSAFHRFGLSATPWRDMGDDILIDGCFGKIIADINASFLIERGYLIQPQIFFVQSNNSSGLRYQSYPKIYQHAIRENTERNMAISKIATEMLDRGRLPLVLVKQIAHGKLLETIIPNSTFLHGSVSKKKRLEHLELMRSGNCGVTIATSLPYQESIYIKKDGLFHIVPIGHLCEKMYRDVKNNKIQTLCSLDGKTLSWKNITAIHKHKRENNVVRVRTNKHEDVYVTENHSLVDTDLQQIYPQKDNPASVPISKGFRPNYYVYNIDCLELFKDVPSAEVNIVGLNQSIMRKIRSEYRFIKNPKNVSKSTRTRVFKDLSRYGESYIKSLILLIDNMVYYKGRYRISIKNAIHNPEIFKHFEGRIVMRRSRKNASLPLNIKVTESLAVLMGLLTSEGHIKEAKCSTCKSNYNVIFTGLQDMRDSKEGNHDSGKKNIRKIFVDCCLSALNIRPISTNKHLKINGKLYYYLFKKLGVVDSNGDKQIPNFILNSSKDIQESYLWGHYLGDGSKKLDYRKGKKDSNIFTAIIFSSSSRVFVNSLCFLLNIMGKRFYLHSQEPLNNTKRRYNINVIDSIKDLYPNRKVDKKCFSHPDRVQSIVDIADRQWQTKTVYDISVDGCHNFIAGNGVLAHNTIFDEGVDVKPLDTLLLAGSGKSATRALQRIGRILRPFPDVKNNKKELPIAVDFMDNAKHVKSHSEERLRIYKTEPKFIIKHLDLG